MQARLPSLEQAMNIGERRSEPAAAVLLILDRGMGCRACPPPSGRGHSYRAAARGVLPPILGARLHGRHLRPAARGIRRALIFRRHNLAPMRPPGSAGGPLTSGRGFLYRAAAQGVLLLVLGARLPGLHLLAAVRGFCRASAIFFAIIWRPYGRRAQPVALPPPIPGLTR